ncbi:hypothetical protein J4217_04180 [Candidatus Pacearchaeota archaeon]|nr:hypothetical protein [Candidatus Pacearchaeota archaeon]
MRIRLNIERKDAHQEMANAIFCRERSVNLSLCAPRFNDGGPIYLERVAQFGEITLCGASPVVPGGRIYCNADERDKMDMQMHLYLGDQLCLIQHVNTGRFGDSLRVYALSFTPRPYEVNSIADKIGRPMTPGYSDLTPSGFDHLLASSHQSLLEFFIKKCNKPWPRPLVIFESERERQLALDFLQKKFGGERK